MTLNCLIIDDEPLAQQQMKTYVERTPFLSLSSIASDAGEGTELFYKLHPDLLFVDINMPGMNGMDFVKALPEPVYVIFTTAYSEYALEGFKVDAIDYLLKPIGYQDFMKAVNKVRQIHELQNKPDEHISGNEKYLFVKSEYRLVRIRFTDIKYIEGMREYVRIHLTDGIAIMTLLSMKSLEERLPKESFMRVHRSFIVNLEKVTVIERQRIVFDKNCYIPISDNYKEEFENYINKHFL
ncbi:MAG: LytTR family DNA-binding domain-containing protein [Candidatus Azobacteroides sp.]|nr:LytTR family DNA-binding domain-containing protein [Candidatus Azobacteroides sp.]